MAAKHAVTAWDLNSIVYQTIVTQQIQREIARVLFMYIWNWRRECSDHPSPHNIEN